MVWVNGADEITGLAAHNGFLVHFWQTSDFDLYQCYNSLRQCTL
jgi:hypothetical protein